MTPDRFARYTSAIICSTSFPKLEQIGRDILRDDPATDASSVHQVAKLFVMIDREGHALVAKLDAACAAQMGV